MDDILDLMEDASQSVFLYDIRKIPDEAKRLAEICVACAEKVKAAVSMLDDMANAEAIIKVCAEIDRYETDADQVLRSAMAKLFCTDMAMRVTTDAVQIAGGGLTARFFRESKALQIVEGTNQIQRMIIGRRLHG